MSKTDVHAPFNTFSGTIGKLVYRNVRGRTIVALRPKRKGPPSEAALAYQQHFTRGSRWAKAALLDEEKGPFYQALGKKMEISAYAAAMSDFLKVPSLEALDLSGYAGKVGNRIYFEASDNGGLVKAYVTIGDGKSLVYEGGNAVEVEPGTGYWMYTARTAIQAGTPVVINVEVADRPRNVVELTEEKTL